MSNTAETGAETTPKWCHCPAFGAQAYLKATIGQTPTPSADIYTQSWTACCLHNPVHTAVRGSSKCRQNDTTWHDPWMLEWGPVGGTTAYVQRVASHATACPQQFTKPHRELHNPDNCIQEHCSWRYSGLCSVSQAASFLDTSSSTRALLHKIGSSPASAMEHCALLLSCNLVLGQQLVANG